MAATSLTLSSQACLYFCSPICSVSLSIPIPMDCRSGLIRISSTPVRDPETGAIFAAAACGEDVTDQVRAEEERTRLRAAEQATANISQLMANVSGAAVQKLGHVGTQAGAQHSSNLTFPVHMIARSHHLTLQSLPAPRLLTRLPKSSWYAGQPRATFAAGESSEMQMIWFKDSKS